MDLLLLKVFCPYQTHHITLLPCSNFVNVNLERRKLSSLLVSCLSFFKWKRLHYMMKVMMWYIHCHLCVTALIRGRVKWKRGEAAFVEKGFCNWKDAIATFRKHEGSDCHKSAVEAMVTLPSQCKDITENFSNQISSDKRDNRHCLLKIISNVRYIAFRGMSNFM